MTTSNPRQFPPGMSWLPAAGALLLLLIISFFAVRPHYTNGPATASSGGNGSGYVGGNGGGNGGGAGTGQADAAGAIGGGGGAGGSGGGSAGGYVGGTSGSYVGGTSGSTVGGTSGSTVGGSAATTGSGTGSSGGGSGGGAGGSGGGGGGGSGTGTGNVKAPTNVTGSGSIDCSKGNNGGSTDHGVTGNEISIASTIVTSGVGAGFLGQAQDGMQAAINQFNASGGACGRRVKLTTVNSGWSYQQGGQQIQSFINSNNYFALVGQPDSEGLSNAIDSGHIDAAGIPVVGTDGMLADQYKDKWVWPVAASTVTNMHIIAQYAVHKLGVTNGGEFGIVYDTAYAFGAEGAKAFNNEVQRLTGSGIPGFGASAGCTSADKQYCGVNSTSQDYTSQINQFDSACAKCKVVVMLLEPAPMETWMSGEASCGCTWFKYLFGGEPLFDDNVADNCPGCGQAPMRVWTGYEPAISPYDGKPEVKAFCNALKAVSPRDDCHNEFTEGAYIGTELFLTAVRDLAAANAPLTRANLQKTLNSETFDVGLVSQPLKYSDSLPHLTNTSMAEFQENYSGSFNGWSYLNTGFVSDSSAGKDI